MKIELMEELNSGKAMLRGAMAALKSKLEDWEKKEFEEVRKFAIRKIRRCVKGLNHYK